MKGKPDKQQNFTGLKTLAQSPSRGGCPGQGRCRSVDPGANVEEIFNHPKPDFQKTTAGHLKIATH